MTLEEVVEKLDGCQYLLEFDKEYGKKLEKAGIVAVFGFSDDVTVFEGAWHDECYSKVYVNSSGIIHSDCPNDDECPYYKREISKAKTIESLWDQNDEGFSWTYKTDIPHLTFKVMEDDKPYCKGIVFYAKDADV